MVHIMKVPVTRHCHWFLNFTLSHEKMKKSFDSSWTRFKIDLFVSFLLLYRFVCCLFLNFHKSLSFFSKSAKKVVLNTFNVQKKPICGKLSLSYLGKQKIIHPLNLICKGWPHSLRHSDMYQYLICIISFFKVYTNHDFKLLLENLHAQKMLGTPIWSFNSIIFQNIAQEWKHAEIQGWNLRFEILITYKCLRKGNGKIRPHPMLPWLLRLPQPLLNHVAPISIPEISCH